MKILHTTRSALSLLWVCLAFAGCFGEADAVRFAPGSGVLPCPESNLVAVQEKSGEWVVYDSAGKEIIRFDSFSKPVWARDDRGDVLLCQGAKGLMKIPTDGSGKGLLLHSDKTARPWQRLGDASRVLIAFMLDEKVTHFSILDLREHSKEARRKHVIQIASATHLSASPDGDRVAYMVPDENLYCLCVLRLDPKDGLYRIEQKIGESQIEHYFWSRSGQSIFYWNAMGTFERFDLTTGSRNWLANTSFVPGPLTPFEFWIDSQDQWIVLETIGKYGFHQVARILTQTAKLTDITIGWIDHYSPVLSWDENYLAYRQTLLPQEGRGDVTVDDESVYILDFRDGRGHLLCKRPFASAQPDRGPAFGGEHRFVYFEKNGDIYQCFLEKL